MAAFFIACWLHVVILLFDFQSLTEVQNRFDCVTDLEILVDHPLAFP